MTKEQVKELLGYSRDHKYPRAAPDPERYKEIDRGIPD
jgi:hypothetical protein